MNLKSTPVIWHNPRCAKSRETLELLIANGYHPEVRLYLKAHPSFAELKHIIKALGVSAESLVRKKEPIYSELKHQPGDSEDAWIRLMVDHPILIERPIVIIGPQAIIARPPEKVLAIL